MSQLKRRVEERLEKAEGALALLGRARRLAEIASLKADLAPEPIRSSLIDDLVEIERAQRRAQERILELRFWILDGEKRDKG